MNCRKILIEMNIILQQTISGLQELCIDYLENFLGIKTSTVHGARELTACPTWAFECITQKKTRMLYWVISMYCDPSWTRASRAVIILQ